MTTVFRVTSQWGGFTGAPGFTKMAFQGLVDDTLRNSAGAAVRAFWEVVKPYIPNGTTILVLPTIDEYDMATGVLTGASVMTTPPAVTTSTVAAAPYAAGSGFVVTWNTPAVFNGHRVKGRTFIVPSVGSNFINDGTLNTTLATLIAGAGNALCSATPDFSVWSRLYDHATPPSQIGGAVASATSCTVKPVASQLRSRRL